MAAATFSYRFDSVRKCAGQPVAAIDSLLSSSIGGFVVSEHLRQRANGGVGNSFVSRAGRGAIQYSLGRPIDRSRRRSQLVDGPQRRSLRACRRPCSTATPVFRQARGAVRSLLLAVRSAGLEAEFMVAFCIEAEKRAHDVLSSLARRIIRST